MDTRNRVELITITTKTRIRRQKEDRVIKQKFIGILYRCEAWKEIVAKVTAIYVLSDNGDIRDEIYYAVYKV